MSDNQIEHHKARKKCPPIADLAPLIQSGMSLADVAARYGFSVSTLRQNFRHAGLSPETGLPPVPKPMPPRPVEAPFDYHADDMRGEGACFGADPALFYPDEVHFKRRDDVVAEAKALCAECPIRLACLSFALKVGDEYAILGGLTADERAGLVGAVA